MIKITFREYALRAKIKALAAESRAIRVEELRVKGSWIPGTVRKELAKLSAAVAMSHGPSMAARGNPEAIAALRSIRKARRKIMSDAVGASAEFNFRRNAILTCRRLHRDRVERVRADARYHLLAYAFLRGVPYRVVESAGGKHGSPALLSSVVSRYSGTPNDFAECNYGRVWRWLCAMHPASSPSEPAASQATQ